MVTRIVSGSRYGVGSWILQRVSAVIMLGYTLLFFLMWVMASPTNQGSLHVILHLSWMRPLTLLFLLALFVHAWVGMRDIFMDYVQHTGLRLILHAVVISLLVLYTLWALRMIWRLA